MAGRVIDVINVLRSLSVQCVYMDQVVIMGLVSWEVNIFVSILLSSGKRVGLSEAVVVSSCSYSLIHSVDQIQ